MSFNKKNFIQQRKQSLYEREISRILYEIVQEYNLPSLSLSYCELSTRGENIKVYLSFRREENQLEILNLINKEYSPLIKKELARSKNFSSLPRLVFLLDKEWEIRNSLKKTLQKLTHEN